LNRAVEAVNLTSVCAYGGGPMGEQLSALKKGPKIRRIFHWQTHSAHFARIHSWHFWHVFFFWHGLSRKNQLHRPSQKLLASQKIQVKNWMRRVRNYTDPSHPESKLGVRQIDRKQTKPNSETDGQPTMRLEYFFINFERQVHSKTLSIVQVVDM
jgi:hypothetical protein